MRNQVYLVLISLLVLVTVFGIVGLQQKPLDQGGGSASGKKKGVVVANEDGRRKLAQWVKRYQEQHPDENRFPRAHYFDKDMIKEMLRGKSEGIRVYSAIDDAGAERVVLIAVDEDNKDIFEPETKTAIISATYYLGYTEEKCPANCDRSSPVLR